MTFFSDGFHSGVMIAQQDFPLIITHQGPMGDFDSRRAPWLEMGYSEREWYLDLDRGALHVIRLAAFPADGLLCFRLLRIPERMAADKKPHLQVRVPMTNRAMKRLQECMTRWVDVQQMGYVRIIKDDDAAMACSRLSYSVWRNCHDFTADLMSSIGLPSSTTLLRLPGSLEDDLRSTQLLIDQPRFTAVDIP